MLTPADLQQCISLVALRRRDAVAKSDHSQLHLCQLPQGDAVLRQNGQLNGVFIPNQRVKQCRVGVGVTFIQAAI